MGSNDDLGLGVFQETLFKNTLLNALDTVIDTISWEKNEERRKEYREELKSRFSNMINETSEISTGDTEDDSCEGDTEDDIPYYYAVVDAKSFGKYLIPTYKPLQRPVETSPPCCA